MLDKRWVYVFKQSRYVRNDRLTVLVIGNSTAQILALTGLYLFHSCKDK